uniref:Nuclear Testis protein N-terminal domain-containing protein n=1 Tax=Oncorhynchus mykiss TaxID=8022 RepID=A0A8C7NYM3_ONCMY
MDLGDTQTASISTPLPHTDPDESKSVTAQGANPDCGVNSERPMSESEPPPQILWESHPAQTVSISPLPDIDPEESESVLKLETAPCPEVDPENTNSDSVPCQTQEEFDSAQKPSEQRDPVPGLILLTDLSFTTVSETALCLGPELDPYDMRGSEDPISASEPPQIDLEPDPELVSMPRPTPHLHVDSRELEATPKLGPDPSPDTDSENPRSTTETPPELQGEPDPAEIPSEQPATALSSMSESEVDLASPAVSCSVSCVGQPDLCNGMRSENPMPASEPLQIEIEKCPELVQIQANDPLPHLVSQEFEPVPPHQSDPAQTGLQPEQPAPVSLTVKTEPGLSSLAILYPAAYIRQEPGVETLQSDSQGRDRILESSHLRCLQPKSQSVPYFPPIQSLPYSPMRPQQSPSISNGPCPMICHSILIPSCPPLDLPSDYPSYHPQMNHNCPQPGPNHPSMTPQPRTNFLSLAPQLRPNHLQPPLDLQLGPGLPGHLPGMAGSIPGSIPSQPLPPQAWCRSEGSSSRGMFENYRWWQNLRDIASKIYPDSGPDAEALACFFIPVIRSLCLKYPSLLFTQGIGIAVGEWGKLSNYDRMEYYHLAQK